MTSPRYASSATPLLRRTSTCSLQQLPRATTVVVAVREEQATKPRILHRRCYRFFLKTEPKASDTTTIEILDASGQVIRKFSSARTKELEEPLDPDAKKQEKELELKAGLNRLSGTCSTRKPVRFRVTILRIRSRRKGPWLPGKYQVRLTSGGKTQTAPFELRLDPRVKVSAEDLQKQFDLRIQIREQLSRIADAVAQIDDVRAQPMDYPRASRTDRITMRSANPPRISIKSCSKPAMKVIEKRILANEDSLAYPARVDIRLADWHIASAMTAILLLRNRHASVEKLKKLVDDNWQAGRNCRRPTSLRSKNCVRSRDSTGRGSSARSCPRPTRARRALGKSVRRGRPRPCLLQDPFAKGT